MSSFAWAESPRVKKETAVPVRPARPVLPTRWTYSSGCFGKSMFTTRVMSSMSMPLAATSVAIIIRTYLGNKDKGNHPPALYSKKATFTISIDRNRMVLVSSPRLKVLECLFPLALLPVPVDALNSISLEREVARNVVGNRLPANEHHHLKTKI